jgi:hypothetical protein
MCNAGMKKRTVKENENEQVMTTELFKMISSALPQYS